MLTSRSNRALIQVRWDVKHSDPGPTGAQIAMLEYLEHEFGTYALNDGFYTPEEIDHARRVLTKFLAVYA